MSIIGPQSLALVLGGVVLGSLVTLGYQQLQKPSVRETEKDKKDQKREESSDEETEDEFSFDDEEEHKMILAVNTSLKMTAGKVAAQCGHAALGCWKQAIKKDPKAVRIWEQGQAKICIQIPDLKEMESVMKQCAEAGIVTYCVQDAGRTQIAAGSRTVLAVGPAPVSKIDKITRSYKLYR